MKYLNHCFDIRTILVGLVGLASVCLLAGAQRMSPMQQDFDKRARGSVEVTNEGDFPKFLTCSAEGFDADDHGKLALHSLDPNLHVRIASERTEIGPKQSRQVSFEATPASVPAWFAVLCKFSPVQRQGGITVNMAIFSVVLVHGPEKVPPEVTLSARHEGSKVIIDLENTSSAFARVKSGSISGKKGKVEIAQFLLFPHRKRIVETEWTEAAAPQIVRIQVGKKTLEAPVN